MVATSNGYVAALAVLFASVKKYNDVIAVALVTIVSILSLSGKPIDASATVSDGKLLNRSVPLTTPMLGISRVSWLALSIEITFAFGAMFVPQT